MSTRSPARTAARSTRKPKPVATRRQAVHATAPAVPSEAGMALYRQVKTHILRNVQSGRWAPGSRLPSENELVAEFGISRMTVNRALRELASEGRVTRVAGVGSFVAESRPQSTLLDIANIASEIRSRGHDYRCQMLLLRREAATAEVAHALGVAAGDSVFHSRCLHFENGVPVQLESRWVNPRAAPDFGAQDFAAQTPSEYLVQQVPFHQIEHVVDAVLPDAEHAQALAIAPGEPCLLLTRRTWNDAGVVTWVRCLHPASRYRLGSRIKAGTADHGA